MIECDARTVPWLWRRCAHVYDPDAAYPRRCLGCRAVDHGAGPAPRHHSNDGYLLGSYPYPTTVDEMPRVTINLCPEGHEMVRTRYVRPKGESVRYACHVCRDARRGAKLLEPCDVGHVGSRYDPGYASSRGIRCRECENDRRLRNKRARATSITRAYAEASAHA